MPYGVRATLATIKIKFIISPGVHSRIVIICGFIYCCGIVKRYSVSPCIRVSVRVNGTTHKIRIRHVDEITVSRVGSTGRVLRIMINYLGIVVIITYNYNSMSTCRIIILGVSLPPNYEGLIRIDLLFNTTPSGIVK